MTTIYVYTPIYDGEYGGFSAIAMSEALKNAGGKDVTVRINSPGGLISEGVAIYNQLKSYARKVRVVVDGMAGSIASVIALAGSEIIMGDGSMMFIHMPLMGMTWGNAEQLRKQADDLDKFGETLIDIYEKRTGMSREDILAMMKSERYLTPREAVDMKFADSIGVPVDAGAIGNRMNFFNTVTNAAPVAAACTSAGVEFSAQSIAALAEKAKQVDALQAKVADAEKSAKDFIAQASAELDAEKTKHAEALAAKDAEMKAAADKHAADLEAKGKEVEKRATYIAIDRVGSIGFNGTPPSTVGTADNNTLKGLDRAIAAHRASKN